MSKGEGHALKAGDAAPVAANSDTPNISVRIVLPKEARAPASAPAIALSPAKRAFDIAASVAALVFAAPLMAVIFVLVRLDGGPGVFVQQRVGRDGALFPCYKFRTMVPDAEKILLQLLSANPEMKRYWDENRKLPTDPRVTRLGVFLRRKSLDELPQLVNVLLGHMSFVGPRPIVLEERECYGDDFSYYALARPGITGLWQVSGRNERSYAERVALDVDYVSNWSLGRDFRILVATVGAVLSGRGAC